MPAWNSPLRPLPDVASMTAGSSSLPLAVGTMVLGTSVRSDAGPRMNDDFDPPREVRAAFWIGALILVLLLLAMRVFGTI
jgi:hypothetical protein